jgi:hypothetical protein
MKRDEILVVAKPILFNTEMVRAILESRKTQTRRPLNPQPYFDNNADMWSRGNVLYTELQHMVNRLRYQIGDVLYVRETFYKHECYSKECIMLDYLDCNGCTHTDDGMCYAYKATHDEDISVKWRPSIHMPKEAARIFLRVTNVRVERLNDISDSDLMKEGTTKFIPTCLLELVNRYEEMVNDFRVLWNCIYGKPGYSWEDNPWIEVCEFERMVES